MNNSFCAALIIINKILRLLKNIYTIIAYALFLTPLLYFTCLYADTIYFKDGTSIEGEIIEERYNTVTVREYIPPAVTKTTECLKNQIIKIERQPTKEAIKLAQDTADEKKRREESEKEKENKLQAHKTESTTRKKTADDASKLAQKIAEKKELEKQKEKKKVKPQVKETGKIAASKIPRATQGTAKDDTLKAKEQKPPPEKKIPEKKIVKVTKGIARTGLKAKRLEYKLILRNNEKRVIGPGKMKRTECTIAVPISATNQGLKSIFSHVLKKELALNKDLDALWVTVYTDKEINGLPTAYGIWSPPGGWDDFRNVSDKSKYKWDYRFLYNR